jgi:hypothetical protein
MMSEQLERRLSQNFASTFFQPKVSRSQKNEIQAKLNFLNRRQDKCFSPNQIIFFTSPYFENYRLF